METQAFEPGGRDPVPAVVRGPPDGAVPLTAGLGHDLADQVRGGGEEEECECGEQRMCDQPLKETIFRSMSDPSTIITLPTRRSLVPVGEW